MDEKELDKMIEEFNSVALNDEPESDEQPTPEQVKAGAGDIYRNQYNARQRAAKTTFPKGSSAKVLADTQAVLPQLRAAYNRAKDDSDSLKRHGDNTRAEMVEQQYTEEHFLPAVEAVIGLNTPGEMVNCNKALEEFDKYARLNDMSGTGFTRSYIKSAFTNLREARPGMSNSIVRDELGRIVRLMQNDNIRAATGLAQKLQNKIDNGEYVASPDDYDLIQRIVLR